MSLTLALIITLGFPIGFLTVMLVIYSMGKTYERLDRDDGTVVLFVAGAFIYIILLFVTWIVYGTGVSTENRENCRAFIQENYGDRETVELILLTREECGE